MPEELSLDNPLVIVGDEDVILGFKALGFKTYAIKNPEELKMVLGEMVKNRTGVCLVQDNIYKTAQDEIDLYKSLPLPIFIPFSKSGDREVLNNLIKDARLRATGTVL